MFSSKKRSAALAAQAQARQEAALAGAGLGISSHQRNASSSTTASIPKPMVSPLQMTFDFELPPSPALSTTNTGEYFRRSRDSDNRERFVPSRDSETPGPSGLSGLSGLGGLSNAGQQRSSSANLAPPPTLPPIARIASLKDDSEREDKDVRGMEASEARKADERTREQGATQKVITPIPAILPTGEDGDDISTAGKRSNVKPIFGFDLPPNDFRSFSRPTSSAGSLKVATLTPPLLQEPPPTTSSAGSTPIMESSLFPAKDGSSISKIDTTPAMTRAFIDSRDKPYGAPAPGKRPQQPLQSTLSSPDLLASSRTTTITAGGRTVSSNYNDFSALSGPSTSASHPNLRPAPQSAHTSPNLLKHPPTSYSGSTQWSSVSSNSTAAASQQSRDVPMLTIGTPYQETASSFPLPQHVATRPRTAGAPVATIGGVSVPTHHTSGYLRPDQHTSAKSEKVEKGERRKTRLLNPMALLARRRSGHDDVSLNNEKAVQAAQAAALQRQKNVAAVGVSKMPEDFDPRIRGKVVHDFSAPRQPRSTPMGRVMAYHHANGQQTQPDLVRGSSVPLIPTVQAEGSTTKQQSRHTSDGTPSGGARRSVHGGMFREHLGEDTDQTRRGNNIQAERLENKDFLHRASYLSHQSTVSQESAVLPPFARRSQALDPAQAALFNDESSSDQGKGTSGYERDSAISSLEGISPVTARSSAIQQLRSEDARAMRESMSPVSPDSPDKRVSVIGSGSESGSASASRNESRSTSAVPVTAISPPESTGNRPASSYFSQPKKEQADGPSPVSPGEGTLRGTSPLQPAIEVTGENDGTPKPPSVIEIPMPMRTPPEVPARVGSAGPSPLLAPGTPNGSLQVSGLPSPSLSISSNQPTPEPQIADSVTALKAANQVKLVEKRASAVEHAKRASNMGMLKHHVSNASRFSFQFGGSVAEEQALEEKHRKMASLDSGPPSGEGVAALVGDDEEDDYFDEDAMDDMDEMEMQSQSQQDGAVNGRSSVANFMYRPAALSEKSKQKQDQLQLDVDKDAYDGSEGGSEDEDEDEDEAPYWMHEAFQGYSSGFHTRDPSMAEQGGRKASGSGPSSGTGTGRNSGLTLDTSVGPSAPVPTLQQVDEKSRSGFYMQPTAAGYSPPLNNIPKRSSQPQKPPLPHRDSGNSERNRTASGLNFSSPTLGQSVKHQTALSSSTVGSVPSIDAGRHFSQSTVSGSSSSEPRTTSTGLGLSGFGDFKFTDSAPSSKHTSLQAETVAKENGTPHRRRKDSETIPSDVNWTQDSGKPSPAKPQHGRGGSFGWGQGVAYNGAVGNGIAARRRQMLDEEDMYFDDGGFDQDVNDGHDFGERVDEDAFDDKVDFWKVNGVGQAVDAPVQGHQRDISALTVTSLGSDGPYPSFAMPNPVKVRQRDSQLLLEDLPLQAGPVDPKLLPRRNPSEDAKRLGLSTTAPPLPPQPGSLEAMQKVNANLQAYHAALADAATKAAAEGRFLRMPSTSTSTSVYSGIEGNGENVDQDASRELQEPSRDPPAEDRQLPSRANGRFEAEMERRTSADVAATALKTYRSSAYSLPRMSFDFGFDSLQLDDAATNDYDDFGNDDDIVAAANAEALASDDEGFYGQEFGFYANARPNSSEVLAINGGFFGLDGDDGLTRNKSLKEPNLTPITERSEFSTRNSFIGMGVGGPHGPHSASSLGPISARLPFSPLGEDEEVMSFDQLRKLKAHAFGGSNASLHSDKSHGLQMASDSPTLSTRSSAAAQGYFGPLGGAPMTFGYSTDSLASSNPSSAHPVQPGFQFHDSPHSAASSGHLPFSTSNENDVTPKRPPRESNDAPLTARKVGTAKGHGHSRTSSGTEVTYVQEQDPAGNGPPRWVLERRRTSQQGNLELIGREVVQGGWI